MLVFTLLRRTRAKGACPTQSTTHVDTAAEHTREQACFYPPQHLHPTFCSVASYSSCDFSSSMVSACRRLLLAFRTSSVSRRRLEKAPIQIREKLLLHLLHHGGVCKQVCTCVGSSFRDKNSSLGHGLRYSHGATF